MIELGLIHWVFVTLLIILLIMIILKKDSSFYYLLAILILGLFSTYSIPESIICIFNSILYVFKDLANIILAVACVISVGNLLDKSGILDLYLKPITKIIKNKYIGFWIIGIVSLILGLFFYPSPAVILVAMIFLPAAKKIDMPILWVAVALNLFAHGFAFSGDYILQTTPSLVANSANISTSTLISQSVPLWLTMGLTTTITAFILLCVKNNKKDEKNTNHISSNKEIKKYYNITKNKKLVFAVITFMLLLVDIILMFLLKLDSASTNALICGTSIVIIAIISMFGVKSSQIIEDTLTEGMKYSITLFAKILPMAAFFYLGDQAFIEILGQGILPTNSQGIINDLALTLSNTFNINKIGSIIMTGGIGAITGLDGSGLSGISLVGTTARLLTIPFAHGIARIAYFGQMLAIYVGGGCLIPVAAIPVALACDIDVRELVKFNFIPILIGAIVTGILIFILI